MSVERWGEWDGLRVGVRGLATVWCPEGPRASPSAADKIAKVASGVARAFVRAERGELSLHASAIAQNGVAVLLVGESGAGKSTTARELVRFGARLLADDACLLRVESEGPTVAVVPSEGAVWLGERDAKFAEPLTRGTTATRLVAWVHLVADAERTTSPTIGRLAGLRAVATVQKFAFRFGERPAEVERAHFERACAVAETVSGYELRRPSASHSEGEVTRHIQRRLCDT